jgi:5-methylcytosine-specific restriction endonuclease McrA|tara:strand:- start:165 stop:341 length:177 start_codon:yes stop_codon:yes gene_type:complete
VECDLLANTPEFKVALLSGAYSAKCELDHIIPKSKNGKTVLENAELTSKEYNRKKSNK